MVGTRVDLQLAQLLRAQLVVREHALDGATDDFLGPAGEQLTDGLRTEAARIAAVAGIAGGGPPVTRHGGPGGGQHPHLISPWPVARGRGPRLAFSATGRPR